MTSTIQFKKRTGKNRQSIRLREDDEENEKAPQPEKYIEVISI